MDGLAELPPIELRPEGEPFKPPSRSPSLTPSPNMEKASSLTMPTPPPFAETQDALVNAVPDLRPTSGSSNSTSLSTSPASSDPLTSIGKVSKNTPGSSQTTATEAVPDLILTDSSDSSGIVAARADSALTVTAPAMTKRIPAESSKPAKARTSGADLILPIIIFAVVKSNPPQLASQLMFLRRYRSAICLTGEASYAIVNLTAVVEFLEHVHLAELGLGDESDKVISVEDLSPIGLNYLDNTSVDAASIASASTRLQGRVFHVGELAGSAAGSANKVITGVVDSSWTALRGLIGSQPVATGAIEGDWPAPPTTSHPSVPGRQASTFSLASVTASVANIAAAAAASTTAARSRARGDSRASAIVNEQQWSGNQEMVEVACRPESIREQGDHYSRRVEETEDASGEPEAGEAEHERRVSDTRSIKSVSSMLSHEGGKPREEMTRDRVSLSNRLASIGALGRPSTADLAGPTTAPENAPSKVRF